MLVFLFSCLPGVGARRYGSRLFAIIPARRRVEHLRIHGREGGRFLVRSMGGSSAFAVESCAICPRAVQRALANVRGDGMRHHRVKSFQDKFRAMLAKQGIAWNEPYVWD